MTRALITALEAATGPEYELNDQIWVATNKPDIPFSQFTSSLDAAIALVEYVMPQDDWMMRLNKNLPQDDWMMRLNKKRIWGAALERNDHQILALASHTHAPIALLIALFKALEKKDE